MTASRNSKLLRAVSAPRPVSIITASGGKKILTSMTRTRYGNSRIAWNIVPEVFV